MAGTIYFSGSQSTVYAVDGASGRLLWKFDPEMWRHYPERMGNMFGVNRGVAYEDGRIFVGTLERAVSERLNALDPLSALLLAEQLDLLLFTASDEVTSQRIEILRPC